MTNNLINIEETSLESLFKTTIKSIDYEQYKKVLFSALGTIKTYIYTYKGFLHDDRKLAEILSFSAHINIVEARAALNAFYRNDIGKDGNENFKMAFLLKITIKKEYVFKYLPKSGLFCTRDVIAYDWLVWVMSNTAHNANILGCDYETSFNISLCKYLLKNHKNDFIQNENETENECVNRIVNEFDDISSKYIRSLFIKSMLK